MALDILLITISDIARPYMMGVATLKSCLDDHGLKGLCFDPVNAYFEKHPYPQESFLKNYSGDCFPFVKDEGEQVELRTQEEKGIYQVLQEKIEQEKPRYIGFSLVAGNYYLSFLLARKLKQDFPSIPIAFGGPAMSDKHPFDYHRIKFVDYFIYGEGEDHLVNILTQTKDQLIEENRDGLTIRYSTEEQDGVHVNSKENPREKDDKLYLPDFSDFEAYQYYRDYFKENQPITLSRGCPYKCTFCNVRRFSNTYINNPVEVCVEEIKKYNQSGIENFMIVDSIINGNPKWLEEFCRSIIEQQLKFSWAASFRIQSGMTDPNYFKMLVEAGCHSMVIGLESASHNVLKDMKKYSNTKKLDEIFQTIRAIKKEVTININLQLIIGYPTETDEDFQNTLNFIFNNMDVIDEVATGSLFLMMNDFKEEYSKSHGDLIHHRSDADWSTPLSTPEVRLERGLKMVRLLEKLKIPYNMYYLDKYQDLVKSMQSKSA